MGSVGSQKETAVVVSQVSFGGFDEGVSARELTDFLQQQVGLIWRCRVKTSWTPPDSYPDFFSSSNADADADADAFSVAASSSSSSSSSSLTTSTTATTIRDKDDYPKVVPHAFVHFASPDAAKRAMNAAGRCDLVLRGRPLRAHCAAESSFRASRRRTTDPFKFSDVRLDIGSLVARDDFCASWTCPSGSGAADFVVDPFDGLCKILFARETAFAFKGTRDAATIRCDFKIEFLARDIADVRLYTDRAPLAMLLQLTSAPFVSYRTADDDIYTSVPFNLLDDEDPWIRTTDFTPTGAVGRCSSYKISLSPRFGAKLERALDYLRKRRIPDYRPNRPLAVRPEPDFGFSPATDHFFSIHHAEGVGFPILFLVNALVHKGIVNQHQLSDQFFGLLRGQSGVVNETALRHIWSYKRPIFDAYRRLKLVQEWLLNNPKLLRSSKLADDNAEVRRLVITPTKAYCIPPAIELSNRVLRRYKEVADRFLRVTFTDEGMQQLNNSVLNYYVAPIVRDITSNSYQQKTTVFKRVKSILMDGFYLCGRRYSFLAFSSNQLRDRSAWFFAEDSKTTVAAITKWMGRFSNRNVAKCAARMGQCFSSTYATVEVPLREVNPVLPDIEGNGYIFSDGIGKITPDLAMEVAEKLKLTDNPPSAYQIRYAGCKGVVAVWPGDVDGIRLSLRLSMNKFESNHTVLEVVSWSRFQPGFLNRQIITLLSSLSVPDSVFARMQESMICKLNEMLVDTDVAFEVLTTSCAEQGNTAAMMLSAGFKPQTEPHLKAMLSCIRSAQLGDLLAKTRIFVPKGRWLMGCLDELGVLEHGQCFIQMSSPSLQNCFIKHGTRFSGTKMNRQVIVGAVVIAKNPCLHPGDVRILEAVDVPGLHQLVDCLVFPQKGDRPHANEASGSDLDGDLYFVTWDGDLIPPGKKSWVPMDYTAAEAKQLPRTVSPQDIIDFFLKNMVNENLGVICNAHVVHADLSEYGAMDEKCLQLAELAATAVDFPKTGKLVTMPPNLRPKLYPDFMGKDDHMSYKSEKILGQLYREIRDASCDDPSSSSSAAQACSWEDVSYDTDLEVPGASDYLFDAWNCKCAYDGQLNALLGQYKVCSEGEVVTGHIWSMPKNNSRKQGELKERLKNAYTALRKEFRNVFETAGPDFNELSDDEKSVWYEQKASAWYQVTYHPKWLRKSCEMRELEGEVVPTRLSFAWIAADYLVRIKVRCQDKSKLNQQRPVDALAVYLSDRI
ncbi:putative RNA-dependent RNA polymerase SHL2 [Ananas comosus]|uniref:RNA-dependent RNA polymerase n=1 Tax=Ananas comosus TaxID=4615 RepID=A0A199UHJ0_ANACO|nr:putative RNA-dependent RNA polymerase SHL2 [Ananas comosus]